MKRALVFFITFLVVLNAVPQLNDWHLRDTMELQERNGLPNYFHKIDSKTLVNVGFLGGSITQENGWRPKVMSWMRRNYSDNSFVEYNAAIGGTNSKYGAFRIDNQLLNKTKLDLVFVEFAVNDRAMDVTDIAKSIEAIIYKVWLTNSKTDICFVYTVNVPILDDIAKGKLNVSASIHDSIASYYGIPSICLGVEIDKLLKTGNVVFNDDTFDVLTSKNANDQNVFTRDGVHPSNYGYAVYSEVVEKCLRRMESHSGEFRHSLNESLIENNYGNAFMASIDERFNFGMKLVSQKGIYPFLDKFITGENIFAISDNAEEHYDFSFEGDVVGFNLICGPMTGNYIVNIDDVEHLFTNFDSYSTYYRFSPMYINVAYGEHIVSIYPASQTLEYDSKIDILSPMSSKQDAIKSPESYIGNQLIFSDVFINGQSPVGITNMFYDGSSRNNKNFTISIQDNSVRLFKQIQNSNSYIVRIYEMNGRIVYQEKLSDFNLFNYSLKSTGVFMLGIYGDSTVNVYKIWNLGL